MFFYLTSQCHNCKKYIELWIMGLHSGLGPPLLSCRKCGVLIKTGRNEWEEMSRGKRWWYYLMSLVYASVGGFFFAIFTETAIGNADKTLYMFLSDPQFGLGIAFWAGLILLLQFIRVRRSQERTLSTMAPPPKYSFWSLDYSLQFKGMTVLLAILLLAAGLQNSLT